MPLAPPPLVESGEHSVDCLTDDPHHPSSLNSQYIPVIQIYCCKCFVFSFTELHHFKEFLILSQVKTSSQISKKSKAINVCLLSVRDLDFKMESPEAPDKINSALT